MSSSQSKPVLLIGGETRARTLRRIGDQHYAVRWAFPVQLVLVSADPHESVVRFFHWCRDLEGSGGGGYSNDQESDKQKQSHVRVMSWSI